MSSDSTVIIRPVVSKHFCSTSHKQFIVRKRPCVVNGGGLVVTDCGGNEVFRLEGCGPTVKHQSVLKDCDGKTILELKRKDGVAQVLCFRKQWKGFVSDEMDDHQKPIFKVNASAISCWQKKPMKVSLTDSYKSKKQWDYEIMGSFTERAYGVYDDSGAIVAEVTLTNALKDIFSVSVQPGVDQAFVFGLAAVLHKLNVEDGY